MFIGSYVTFVQDVGTDVGTYVQVVKTLSVQAVITMRPSCWNCCQNICATNQVHLLQSEECASTDSDLFFSWFVGIGANDELIVLQRAMSVQCV